MLLLLLGAELGDDGSVDGGETTIISSGQPPAESSSITSDSSVHPSAPAAVLLRKVHSDEAEFACLPP